MAQSKAMSIIAYSAENAALPSGPQPQPLYANTARSRTLREEFLDSVGRINERIAVDKDIDPFAVQPFVHQLVRSLTRYDFPDDTVPANAPEWAHGTSVLFLDDAGALYDVHGRDVLHTPQLRPMFNERAVARAHRIRTALNRQGYLVDLDLPPVQDVTELLLPEASMVVDRVICLAVVIEAARWVWRGKRPDVDALSEQFDLGLVTATDTEQRYLEAFARGEGQELVSDALDMVAALEPLAWSVSLWEIPGDRIGTHHPHPQNLVNPKGILTPKKLLERGADQLYAQAKVRTLEEICDGFEYASCLDNLAIDQRERLANGITPEGEILDEAQVATLRHRQLAFMWLTWPFTTWEAQIERLQRMM